MLVYTSSVDDAPFYLGSSGQAQVADGAQGMGLNDWDQPATIHFTEPVLEFGAFWGAATYEGGGSDPETIEFEFFDVDNNLIDSTSFEYSRSDEQNDGLLLWAGWHSDTPIARVTYTADFTAADGMQANVVDVCEGDVNGDGTVDPLDSGFVLARFGCPVGIGDPFCDTADVNGDGVVDPLDSGFVLARFGDCTE